MGKETVAKVLNDFGLTDIETEVYIFLAKHGVLRNREIATQMKKDRAQTLRILKSLQSKGLVEATLEAPIRYTSIPFERVIDLNIRSKKDEAALLEAKKNELLSHWKQIGKTTVEPSPEKFLVIEGDRKIYPRIIQMIKETKNQLSSIFTFQDLARGLQFEVFETVLNHPVKSKIQFRFLTEASNQNIDTVRSLLERLRAEVNIKVRNPDFGLKLAPRMVIRDNEEILFFIKPRTNTEELGDLCLWTDCSDLVQAFTCVFEDLWHNSISLEDKITEIQTGRLPLRTFDVADAEITYKKYQETLYSAEKDIVMMTSSEELMELRKNEPLLKTWSEGNVKVRVIVPITNLNLKTALELSKCCDIRHDSSGCLMTTIVDGRHLFQSNSFRANLQSTETISGLNDIFYTSDREYIQKTSAKLNAIWRNAQKPSKISLSQRTVSPSFMRTDSRNLCGPFGKFPSQKITHETPIEKITEKAILNRIINAKREPLDNPSKDKTFMYASLGQAIIHPPKSFRLPDMLIDCWHIDKNSSYGLEDAIVVNLWQSTSQGYGYLPVAIIGDNPEAHFFWEIVHRKAPAGQNVRLVSRDAIQVQVHGNTLLAAWTVPIPLQTKSYVIPPAALLFEGHGEVKTGKITGNRPDGSGINVEFNSLEAFVTFLHPSSKYAGPATEGVLHREFIAELTPPRDFGP